MTQKIDEPIIQPLGFDGDRYCLKVVFPIQRLEDRGADYQQPAIMKSLGRYGAILKFRAEDLPRYGSDRDELVVIDVGCKAHEVPR